MKIIAFTYNCYLLLTSRRAWLGFLVAIFLLLAGYVYFFHNSVFNLRSREAAMEQIIELETKIAVLENQSLTLLSGINLDLAHSLGLMEISTEPIFATRAKDIRLSLAVDEI
jgi:hypothetical protein